MFSMQWCIFQAITVSENGIGADATTTWSRLKGLNESKLDQRCDCDAFDEAYDYNWMSKRASEWIRCEWYYKCSEAVIVNLHIKFAQFDSSVGFDAWQIGCNNTSMSLPRLRTVDDFWLPHWYCSDIEPDSGMWYMTSHRTCWVLMRKWIINFYIWWFSYLIYTCNYQELIIEFQLFSIHFQLAHWWFDRPVS